METFNKGNRRRANPDYTKMTRTGKVDRKEYIPPKMGSDESFKRLRYVRYADDFLIGVSGSITDCRNIREEIASFLKGELELDLNKEKTLITHARTESAAFLGYRIHITEPSKYPVKYLVRKGKKVLTQTTPRPMMDGPVAELVKKLAEQGYCGAGGKPTSCGRYIHESLEEIINKYQMLQRGLLNYYHMATNYGRVAARVHYVLKYSCALTIARKMRLRTLRKVFKAYGKSLEIKDSKGRRLATYPAISYKKPRKVVSTAVMQPFEYIENSKKYWKKGLSAESCECAICGAQEGIEMHHLRHLRKGKTADWLTERMRRINRKQIPVCRPCHIKIHQGQYDGQSLKRL